MEKKKRNIIKVFIFIIMLTGYHFHDRCKKDNLFFRSTLTLTCISIFFSSYLFLLAGIATGLALYSYMHVWLHKPWAAKWIGGLQKFHMQHHFGQTEKCFGVTNTWWDKIFNTTGKADKIASAKSIELYFGEKNNHNLITHKQAV